MYQSHKLRKTHYDRGLAGAGGLSPEGQKLTVFGISSAQKLAYRPRSVPNPRGIGLFSPNFRGEFAAEHPIEQDQL